ncbi:MAG: FAD-dependent oxidoreductase [Wolinella sp.]
MYDVAIVGGGVAGLSAALTLATLEGVKGWEPLKVVVIDAQKSDLLKAELYNVPMLKQGIAGKDALASLNAQVAECKNAQIVQDEVVEISGQKGAFTLKGGSDSYSAKYVILATGAHKFEIALEGATVVPHTLMPRDGMVALKTTGRNEVKSGVYAAGLVAGVTTMFACASGSGVESACAILSDIAGKVAIIHDFPGSRA